MIPDAPVIGAHFLGDADIQYYQDVGPGQTRVDLASPLDPDYPALLAMVHGQQFEPRRTYPPRPSEHHIWDGVAWIDPRTPADLAAELSRRRSSAAMDKGALVQVLDELRILSPDEVDTVTRGDIPARIEALMGALSADARRAAITKWRLDTVISRTHPVIVAAAYALGISDETLDEIFGVSP